MSAETPLIDIRPDHWEIVQRILQEHVPNLEVWAFGSRAKWNAKAFSDLDLAIITDEPLPIDTSAALNEAFSESDLPWKVDVVDWASISKEFKDIIEQDKVVVQCYSGPVGDGKHKQNKCETSKMLAPWKNLTLGEFVRLQRGYDLTSEQREVGEFPVMGSAGKNGTHSAYKSAGPGVVIGRSGSSMGSVHFTESNYWPHNTCLYVTDFLGNDPRFVYYFLGAQNLAGYNSGSAQPSLNRNFIYNKTILVPSVAEQQAISHILGTLDDKIELNRKQNETLEAMARAMFKAWFVDFEPVRAKMEGRWKRGQSLPGMPAHLYDLFPDRMVESELGEIPEGWEVRSLDSIANYLNGLALQKYPPESENEFLPVIKIAQLRSGDTHGAGRASARISPEYVVENGDVLFSWSGSLEVEVWSGGRGALNQHLFKVTSGLFPKWFYYFATRHHLPTFREIAAGKATTMGHIQRKHLTASKVVIPSMEGMNRIDSVIAPLFEKLTYNAKQSRLLVQLRDSLLPDLVSGDLRVRNPGRVLENMRRL